MDPGLHQLTIHIHCAVTIYVIAIPLVKIRLQNGKYNRFTVQGVIQQNRQFVGVKLNTPIEINTANNLYILLIKRAEDDNDVFQHVKIHLIRNNWRVLFCNQTGSKLKIREKTLDQDNYNTRTCKETRGLVHVRHIAFDSIIEDEENEAEMESD
jgi:hypothetical protein